MNTTQTARKRAVDSSPVDPVVQLSQTMMRLWWAHRGSEAVRFKLPAEDRAGRRELQKATDQLYGWIASLEVTASFELATSLEGALLQMAFAMDRIGSLGEKPDEFKDEITRIRRLLRSAGDAVVVELGDRFGAVSKIVQTYSNFGEGEDHPNWLTEIDAWSAIARGQQVAS